MCIGDRDDVLASKVDSLLCLQELLQQSEGNRWLGRGAALGDIDDAKLPTPQEVDQLGKVVLAHLIAGKEKPGAALLLIVSKGVSHPIVDRPDPEVGAADTDGDYVVALLSERSHGGLDLGHDLIGDRGG